MHKRSHFRSKALFSSLLLAISLTPRPALASGSLMVNPTRVILSDRQRSITLYLTNSGAEETSYRISWLQRKMNEKGRLEAIETPIPGCPFSDNLIRYSPRQVTLPPNKTQVVRLQVRFPADLPSGEYRSHIYFRAIPSSKDAGTDVKKKDEGFDVKISTIIGVSIPIIVRHGETSSKIEISDLKLDAEKDNPKQSLSLRVNRTGNQSVYGDLSVAFIPKGKPSQIIGESKGFAIYTSTPYRLFQIPMGQDLKQGRIHVTYRENPEAGGKILAESDLTIP